MDNTSSSKGDGGSDLSLLTPEQQKKLLSDFRMRAIAETIPNDPVGKLNAEEATLDLLETDPKLKFLVQLYNIKRTYVFNFGKPTPYVTPTTLSEIKEQYATLKAATDQFKDEEDKRTYFEDVNRFIQQIIAIYKLQKEHKEYYESVRRMAMDDILREARPSYAEELVETPWRQFLDKDSPGWVVDWATQPNVVAKQRVPNGGVRIVEKWEKEVSNVLEALDAGRGGPSRFKSGLAEAQTTTVVAPGGRKIRSLTMDTMTDPPYRKLYDNGQGHYNRDLFPMSQMLSRLDRHTEPEDWKVATLLIKNLDREDNRKAKSIGKGD